MPDKGESYSQRAGQIVTFYSFKGGTGRTMALANVAWILAANGLRVLIADWDLESPGLHRFFQPFMDPGVIDRPGIVDYVRRYEWAAVEADVPPAKDLLSGPPDSQMAARAAVARMTADHVSQISEYVVPLSWQFHDAGALHFLSAGKQNIDYQPTLSALDWDNFYNKLHGGRFFDALRAHLKATYDYVLIDSRTGLSDVADICTVHLPDTVVDCFTLSTQGIEGAALMADSIRNANARHITIWPVPMRIDHSDQERVASGLEFAERMLAGLPAGMSPEQRASYWTDVEVPYKSSYAYEETLAVFGDRPGSQASLLAAYERITARITGNAITALPPREEWLRLRTRMLFSRTPEAASPPRVLLDFTPEDQLWAEWIAAVLASAGIAVTWPGEKAVGPATDSDSPAQVVAVMSESYARRTRDVPPAAFPDLLISVDEFRIPSSSQLAEVSAIFLAGRTEDEAVAMLADRLGGQLPAESDLPTSDLRYPGAERKQVLSFPARNVNFTGRDDDLRQLREVLRSRGMTVVLPVTIQGLGGIGKTQLAMEYAHRFKADYDIVWWLDCGQSQYVDASLTDLGNRLREELGASIPDEGGVREVAQQVLRHLSDNWSQHRWLLVYDNAEDIDYIRELLPPGRGHVLVTSRDERWQAHSGRSLRVDVFKPEESVTHLRQRMPGIPQEEAGKVADVLGNMPLAVAAAGALLASKPMSATDYLLDLDAQPELNLPPGHPLLDYPPAVAKAWSLSLDHLQQQSAAASRLLAICSAMAPDISLDLVSSQAMAEAMRTLDPTIQERSMIAKLVRQVDMLALIKVDNTNHRIQVHRVVQSVVSERLSPEQRLAVQGEVHQLLVAAQPEGDVDDPQNWPRYRLIWPHLTPSEAMWSTRREVRDLLVNRVRYLRLRDDLDRGARRASEIEGAWVTMLNRDPSPEHAGSLREQLFRLRFNLANILRDLGDFQQARAVDEEVLVGQRELLTDEHPHILQTRSSLAADLRALGDYVGALELDLETYQSWSERSGFGEEYPGTLSAASNLALSYLLNGDIRNALRYDRLTLERRANVHGDRHPRTLQSGTAVARDLLEAGRYREAALRLEHVWSECRETLRDNDRTTLNARAWLGVAYRCAGRPDVAATHIDAARTGLTRGFGQDSNDALSCRLSQAVNLLALGRTREARMRADELLAIYKNRVGAGHPHTLICRLDLCSAMYVQDEFDAAATQARAAADGLRDRLGAGHPYTLAATMMLANVLARQGDLEEAAELEGHVIEGRARTLGPGHPDTLRSRANHLLTQRELGNGASAGDRQEVIAELARLLGDDHPDISAVMNGRRLLCVIDPQPF